MNKQKKKAKEINVWKAYSIILGIFVLFLIIMGTIADRAEKKDLVEVAPGVEVSSEGVRNILDQFTPQEIQGGVRICSIKDDLCFRVGGKPA